MHELEKAIDEQRERLAFRSRYRPLEKLSEEELAARANTALREIDEYEREALSCIKQVGDTLHEAKRRVGHGPWGQWLADNFDGSAETARNYMRIAEHWVEHVYPALMADAKLSYRGALRIIRITTPTRPRGEKYSRPKDLYELAKESLRDSINQRLNTLDRDVLILMQRHWDAVELAVFTTIARKERQSTQNGNAVTEMPPAEKTTESGNAIVLARRPTVLYAEVVEDEDDPIDAEDEPVSRQREDQLVAAPAAEEEAIEQDDDPYHDEQVQAGKLFTDKKIDAKEYLRRLEDIQRRANATALLLLPISPGVETAHSPPPLTLALNGPRRV